MPVVTVLGGCGAVGGVVVKALAGSPAFSAVVVADWNIGGAQQLARELGPQVSAVHVDVGVPSAVRDVVQGSDVVVNCVGPFYKTVKTVLGAVLDAGVNYVDVCDDVDVTQEILDMSAEAEKRGVTALIGMGASPGVTNLLAKMASDGKLDETHSIDIFHAHGGEPVEGAGVVGHRFHCMTVDIPMFLDGELKYVKYFEPDGIAMRQTFDFPILGAGIELFPYPHPEQITIPRYINVRQVTNKGTVLPQQYYDLTRDICALGLHSKEPVLVGGVEVVPSEFSTAFILRERDRILKETAFGTQRGCCTVVAKGLKAGKRLEIRFHMASESQALGEGTGLPAAIGAIMMLEGKVKGPGVLPPEACVKPLEFLSKVPEITRLLETATSGRFGGLLVQRIGEDGKMIEYRI